MKKLRVYFLGMIASMLFACLFLGVQVKASAPSQVKGLKQIGAHYGSFTVEWKALEEDNVYYEVAVSQNGKQWYTKGKPRSSNYCHFSSLSSGKSYYVRVRGCIRDVENRNEYLFGAYSETLECVTAPSPVKNIRKTASTATGMTLKWDAVPGASEYVVKYSSLYGADRKEKTVRTTSNTITLKKLPKGAKYSVRVAGVRKTADGKYSASIMYTMDPARIFGVTPGKVTGIKCSFYQSSTEIGVSVPASESIRSAEGYKLEVWTANKKKDTRIASMVITNPALRNKKLSKAAFAKYNMIKIRVCAYTSNYGNKKIYGKWSDWKYVCPQPKVTKIQKSGKGLALSWKKISGADRYEVYASTKWNSGYKKVKTTKDTRFTLTKFDKKSLKKGKTYYFYVVACKKVGGKYYSGEAENADLWWSKKFK